MDRIKKTIKEILKTKEEPVLIHEKDVKYYNALEKARNIGNLSIIDKEFKMKVYLGVPVLYCEDRKAFIISEENKRVLDKK